MAAGACGRASTRTRTHVPIYGDGFCVCTRRTGVLRIPARHGGGDRAPAHTRDFRAARKHVVPYGGRYIYVAVSAQSSCEGGLEEGWIRYGVRHGKFISCALYVWIGFSRF